MSEVFPSVDEIAERALRAAERRREAEAARAHWSRENLRIVREFASKMQAAGVDAPAVDVRASGGRRRKGWRTPSPNIFLAPGSRPFWWWVTTRGSGAGPFAYEYEFTRLPLRRLDDLAAWDPAELRDCLSSQLPE